jgi:hypothetical protein
METTVASCTDADRYSMARVKVLAFHPTQSWLLVGRIDGIALIMDFTTGKTIDAYDAHTWGCRGADFHPKAPVFATGGDDCQVRVWDHQTHQLISKFSHLDYVRTVQFHSTQPWLLSASDDQTLAIWDWISGQQLALLTGHHHYVMAGRFHPQQDLVASASLDMTVRLWDVSSLRGEDRAKGPATIQAFSVLEGHTKGVNCVAFHPTRAELLSGSDDHQVRHWRQGIHGKFVSQILAGHTHNVSAVEWLDAHRASSVSEDRSARTWRMDGSPEVIDHTDLGESRGWAIAVDPRRHLLAIGHDQGFSLQHMSALAVEIPSSAPGSAVRINGDDETAQLTVTGPFQVTAVAQPTLTVGKVVVAFAVLSALLIVGGISAAPTLVWVIFTGILIGPWAATLALIIFLVVDPQILPWRAVGCVAAGTGLLTAAFLAVAPLTGVDYRGAFYLFNSIMLVIAAFVALGILTAPAWRMWSRRQLSRSEFYRALRLSGCAVLLLLCARFTIQRSKEFRDHSTTIVVICGLVGAAVGGVVSYLMVKATRPETKRLTAEEGPFELERMLQVKGHSVDEIFAVLKTVLLHMEVVGSGATPSGMKHDLELRTKTAIIRARAAPTDTGIVDLVIVVQAKKEEHTTRYRDVLDLLNQRFEQRRLA